MTISWIDLALFILAAGVGGASSWLIDPVIGILETLRQQSYDSNGRRIISLLVPLVAVCLGWLMLLVGGHYDTSSWPGILDAVAALLSNAAAAMGLKQAVFAVRARIGGDKSVPQYAGLPPVADWLDDEGVPF